MIVVVVVVVFIIMVGLFYLMKVVAF